MGSSLGLGPSTGFGFRFEVRVLTQEATHKLAGYFIFVHHVCVYARDSHCKFQLPFPPFQTDMPRTLSEGRRGSNKKKTKKNKDSMCICPGAERTGYALPVVCFLLATSPGATPFVACTRRVYVMPDKMRNARIKRVSL